MSRFTYLSQFIQRQWLKKGIWTMLLSPLSYLAKHIAQNKRHAFLQQSKPSFRAPVPVIVVGNIFVGGTGKTPLTIALVKALQELGYHPGIISRGYGAKIGKQAIVVDLQHNPPARQQLLAQSIGDEPSLLAQYAPIAVHPRRVKAAQALLNQVSSIDIIISDDGLQHYALARDIEIIVQDQRGIGNGYMLPAGPLREPPSRLESVDFIVTNYNQRNNIPIHLLDATRLTENAAKPHPRQIAMYLALSEFENLSTGETCSIETFLQRYATETIYAMAGIGNPQRFYQSLQALGITPQKTRDFADHYQFQADDLQDFHDGIVLMTSKDASKCRTFARHNWWSVNMQAQFTNPEFFNEIHHLLSHLPLYS